MLNQAFRKARFLQIRESAPIDNIVIVGQLQPTSDQGGAERFRTPPLLKNDTSVIEPDVLSKDRDKFEASGDDRYVDKAHRRGKIGWNVSRRIEVAPHYRRPHMALVWTGRGRAVPKVVLRRGSVVHQELVEKVPSGFGTKES